jgi:hypothetical protein
MDNSQKQYKTSFELDQEERDDRAFNRVKKIKGFYIHLIVYVLVNIGLIIMRTNFFDKGETNFWTWQTFNTCIFWGIGLVAHGASVFGKDIFLGKEWEEKKLEHFLKEEDKKMQQWK